jgi:Ca-activated chloride channel homolog
VMQPLPLPEGVSDYAVGNTALATSKMLSAAASPVAESMKSRGAEVQPTLDKTGEKKDVAKGDKLKESPEEGDSNYKLTLGKITVTGGLTEQSVRKIVQQNLETLRNRCLAFLTAENAGELFAEWVVDAVGKITEVKIQSRQVALDGLELCLRTLIQTWRFPASTGNRESSVSVSFHLDPADPRDYRRK